MHVWMYDDVSMYLCMYGCMHACIYVCMYVWMYHVCMCVARGGDVGGHVSDLTHIHLQIALQGKVSCWPKNNINIVNIFWSALTSSWSNTLTSSLRSPLRIVASIVQHLSFLLFSAMSQNATLLCSQECAKLASSQCRLCHSIFKHHYL